MSKIEQASSEQIVDLLMRTVPPDLVEHLRREASKQDMLACEDMLKAADEIEQLRQAWYGRCVIIDERDDEIERLRAALKDIAIGVGEDVLSQEEMRARAYDALK